MTTVSMVEVRIEADGGRYVSFTFDEATAPEFTDAMRKVGREWEFGGPSFEMFQAGDRVQLTIPQWEFTTAARVVQHTVTGPQPYDTVIRVRETP